MKINKLANKFGKVINDIDLSKLNDDELLKIALLLAEHGLLLFPKQILTDNDIVSFSRRLGALEPSARKICHADSDKHLSNLTNLKNESNKPLGFPGNSTDYWHSDQEFRENPATLATLYCLIPSEEGGTTSFASTSVKNLNIDEQDLECIRDLSVTYIPASTHDNVAHIKVIHPALLISPSTGNETVYVSENTQEFLGLDENESNRIKSTLLSLITNSENVYALDWQMGDFVLYDNTQLLHRRDKFSGNRWLKATKIYADNKMFAVPDGELYSNDEKLITN